MANFLKSLFVKGIEIDPAGATSAQVLSYNGTKFVPTTAGVGALGLDDLSDVAITTPAVYQTVVYNGSGWVNSTLQLGTNTNGNYMSGITAGTGISVTHTPAEGSSATIAVDTAYSGFVPIGAVTMFSGSTAPTNWAVCDGAELAIATYGPLYAIIGTRYGALTNGSGGVGTTHFKLPSFTSRIPKGTVGTPTVPTTITSSASSAVDTHTHTINSTFAAGNAASHVHANSFTAGNAADHLHNHSLGTGNGSANHSHVYFKGNSGGNTNTGGDGAAHSHGINGGIGAADRTLSVNSSFTSGGVNTAIGVNSSFTAGNASTINASTLAHTHGVNSVDIVFIIRVA